MELGVFAVSHHHQRMADHAGVESGTQFSPVCVLSLLTQFYTEILFIVVVPRLDNNLLLCGTKNAKLNALTTERQKK